MKVVVALRRAWSEPLIPAFERERRIELENTAGRVQVVAHQTFAPQDSSDDTSQSSDSKRKSSSSTVSPPPDMKEFGQQLSGAGCALVDSDDGDSCLGLLVDLPKQQ